MPSSPRVARLLGRREHAQEPFVAIGLSGGLALYFAGHVAHRLRVNRTWGRGRPIATVALLAIIPVATTVPALVALALAAGVCAGLIAYEAIRYSYARAWIRSRRGSFTMEEAERVAPRTGRNPDLGVPEQAGRRS